MHEEEPTDHPEQDEQESIQQPQLTGIYIIVAIVVTVALLAAGHPEALVPWFIWFLFRVVMRKRVSAFTRAHQSTIRGHSDLNWWILAVVVAGIAALVWAILNKSN